MNEPAQPTPNMPPHDRGDAWNAATWWAVAFLVAIWAFKIVTTWQKWGDVTVDSGHEMYVPAALLHGATLYRDVWYMYGPFAPFLSAFLFRLFGVQLGVLNAAGALCALGTALFLFLAGMRMRAWVAGWTAGAVVLLEGFHPWLFSFPLPYAMGAAYASCVSCLCLWLIVSATRSRHWGWTLAAAVASPVALMLKPEYGITCYATLGALLFVRDVLPRDWRLLARDAALCVPGIAMCAATIAWMVSIRGAEFITQENIASWPTSYFMKTFGKFWLDDNGFTVTAEAFRDAGVRFIPFAMALAATAFALRWKRSDLPAGLVKALLIGAAALAGGRDVFAHLFAANAGEPLLSPLFFPQDMVLYLIVCTVVAAGWWAYRRRGGTAPDPALPLVLAFASLLAFRILMKMTSYGYPIFYNGPVILAYLVVVSRLVVPRAGRSRRFILGWEMAMGAALLVPAQLQSSWFEARAKDWVPLVTERGTIKVSTYKVESYGAAIAFMKGAAARGESVLSLPEDTSLYFLSGTYCPVRMYLLTPGVVAPGRMTEEVIADYERAKARWILWSNRTFAEYGVPEFGRDFDREIGDYLRAHYHPVRPLVAHEVPDDEWTAVIWERNADAAGGASGPR